MSEARLKAAVAGESGLPRNASRMERARLALDRLEVVRGSASVRYGADALGGEPILTNCAVLCTNCHGAKTAKGDVPRIAKAVRTYRKNINARPRPKHRWPSRKFSEQWRA